MEYLYTVNFHDGTTTTFDNIADAVIYADVNARYSQLNITIYQGDEIVAQRIWYGCLDDIADCKYPIQFGDKGFYDDWTFYEL